MLAKHNDYNMQQAGNRFLVVSGTSNSGKAIVEKVAESGGSVVFSYHTREDLANEMLEQIPGENHHAVSTDVTDNESVNSLVTQAVDIMGGIDSVIYTVGIISRSRIGDTEKSTWENHLEVNVTGAFYLLKSLTPVFIEQGYGSVVALSATDGIFRNVNLSAYDASKAGLEALIKEAARELGPHGIRANAVAPGSIREPDSLTNKQKEEIINEQSLKKVVSPSDIADACLFLCSDSAKTITGTVLPVDSGFGL